MKSFFRFVISTCLVSFLSGPVAAEAPVVDDSENFALLEQQVTNPSPVANDGYDDNQPALARDTSDMSAARGNVDLINKIQGLQQEIQELRGQLEVQTHELKVLQEQQLSFYNDLDARISGRPAVKAAKNGSSVPATLEMDENPLPATHAAATMPPATTVSPAPMSAQPMTSTASATGAVVAATTTNPNPADEQISYLKAYELVKNKQYDDAMVAMQTFTQKYPQGGYTANAEYWLGELCLVKHDYTDAIHHFSTVLQQFPSSSKYSASLLKMGYALADAGQVVEAKERLHEVMKKYPDTSTANLARLKLETLGG